MSIDFRHNFVSAQYLENEKTEFRQILYEFILARSRLGLLPVKFCLFVTELWSLIDVRISFPLNIFRTWPFYSMKSAAVGL